MTDSPRAWVLNLDAEYELARGPRHTASQRLLAALEGSAAQLAASLPAGDLVLQRDCPSQRAQGLRGRAWCPTPQALARLRRAGAQLPSAPGVEVLRRVHERGFAHALSLGELEGAERIESLEALRAKLANPSLSGDWLLKRGFGVAGRGLRAVHPGPLSEPDAAWARASLVDAPLYVEPRVQIAREFSVHGWIHEGASTLRVIREFENTAGHAWSRNARARLDAPTEKALLQSAERVAAALALAGYEGPFGVDAFEWLDPRTGSPRLRSVSEINPRYCMGWGDDEGWDPV